MTVKDPSQMTLNLPPLEETRDPEYEVNCCNWRNWLAFLLASLIVLFAYYLVIYRSDLIDLYLDAIFTESVSTRGTNGFSGTGSRGRRLGSI